MTSHTILFTFIAEHDGSTELEQVTSMNLHDAVRRWNAKDGGSRIPLDRLDLDEPTPVEGLDGVWCFSGIDQSEKLYIVHVVRTAKE